MIVDLLIALMAFGLGVWAERARQRAVRRRQALARALAPRRCYHAAEPPRSPAVRRLDGSHALGKDHE